MNRPSSRWHTIALRTLVYGVAVHGVVIMITALEDQLHVHFSRFAVHANGYVFSLPMFLGLSLVYVAMLLRRRKHTAWLTALGVYGVILALTIVQMAVSHHFGAVRALRGVVLPLVAISLLLYFKNDFRVRSDVRSFASAARFSALILAVALLYGVTGFLLLDKRDFHSDISVWGAVQRTVDQFGWTTEQAIVPHTRRAHLFVDSLRVVSVAAVGYAALALFQPIKGRLVDQTSQRELARELLQKHHGNSEDFFKLWPEDKHYFFNLSHTAGVAYGVRNGVALVAGDPFGDPQHFDQLLSNFDDFCRINDWRSAYIHIEPKYEQMYRDHGYGLQKLGEEAILHLDHFQDNIQGQKYFRQIRNKFTKQGFTTEMFQPPHNSALLARLQTISDEWLTKPGREERTFMLGYYSSEYMQHCPVMVLRDAVGTIQAFINQVPSFDPDEANYDLLRYTSGALGNANDFLLMEFIAHLHQQGFKRLNLGLCMFAGVGSEEERTLIDNALRLLYAKGDRFYSFSGLHRFKAKYEPEWSSRYIAYRGGISRFTRVATALNNMAKM